MGIVVQPGAAAHIGSDLLTYEKGISLFLDSMAPILEKYVDPNMRSGEYNATEPSSLNLLMHKTRTYVRTLTSHSATSIIVHNFQE